MGLNSKIEWTDATWNPVTGCTKVSAGCKHCYAERMFPRVYASQNVPSNGSNSVIENTGIRPRKFTDVHCHPERLEQPLHWKKPRRIFVCSMSDMFHEAVPDELLWQVFAMFQYADQHLYQVLTKRPDRMKSAIERYHAEGEAMCSPSEYEFSNVWWGVSVEDQKAAERINFLLETPAPVRWVSYEPALGPVDFTPWIKSLDWLVCGGESGPSARPMHPDWARSVRDQCLEAGVPFFFKQWGKWAPRSHCFQQAGKYQWGTIDRDGSWWPETTPWNGHDDDGEGEAVMISVGKKAAGRLLDGKLYNEFPGENS